MAKIQKPKSIFTIPLIREITVVLLIKLAVIFWIKHEFFSNPVDLTQAETSVESHMGLMHSSPSKNQSEKNDG